MKIDFKEDSQEGNIVFTNKDIEKHQSSWKHLFKRIFRSRIGKIFLYIFIPAVIFNFWLLRYDDFSAGCHIKIKPSITELNNLKIKKAIRLLKAGAPADYQEMCLSVKSISPELACGGMGGGCFNQKRPNEIVVSTVFRPKEYHTETTSAIIAHEVCHLYQHKENRTLEETECYDDYCRVLKTLNAREGYDQRCSNGSYSR